MGYYDTKKLPIYTFLHSPGAPNYVIADSFFQAAFGGSFLNHQWLIAAATPSSTRRSTTAVRTTFTR
jgi:phospholipase C